MSHDHSEADALARDALAREIVERATGRPAYLSSDEEWAAAQMEARATYVPPAPESSLAEAIRKARHPDPVEFIEAYNAARRAALNDAKNEERASDA